MDTDHKPTKIYKTALSILRTIKITLATIILLCVVLFIGFIIHDVYFSDYAMIGKQNVHNAEKLKKGMTAAQVIAIMGIPSDSAAKNGLEKGKPIRAIHYPSNNDDFIDIEITFNRDNIVEEIFIPYVK